MLVAVKWRWETGGVGKVIGDCGGGRGRVRCGEDRPEDDDEDEWKKHRGQLRL
jgi:hypothetical protein